MDIEMIRARVFVAFFIWWEGLADFWEMEDAPSEGGGYREKTDG